MDDVRPTERERLAASRPLASISSRVAASWRRSAGYGIPLDTVDPAFAGAVDDGSLFFESGRRVVAGLQESLADEPVSVMLIGADGLVLSREGRERTLLAALDAVHLAPGFDFSERETGTTGLGLALADHAPSLVRGEEHYCTRLWDYTCAAVPVDDPESGEMVGTVNLTTWSRRSSRLLLALARSAARETEALMLARGRGRAERAGVPAAAPAGRPRRGAAAPPELGAPWAVARRSAAEAVAQGRVVACVGEEGTGRTTLLTEVHAERPGHRVRAARPPASADLEAWLALWCAEPADDTTVVVGPVDRLPAWAAAELATVVARADGSPAPIALTTDRVDDLPAELSDRVDVVVEIPPLRRRRDDVLPLARYFARRFRGPGTSFTLGAEHALTAYHWPGNVTELRDAVRVAVARSSVVTVRDLPPGVVSGPGHHLTRMEAIERDEIARCLAEPGASVTAAAAELGMSRATVYRRIARYGLARPTGSSEPPDPAGEPGASA